MPYQCNDDRDLLRRPTVRLPNDCSHRAEEAIDCPKAEIAILQTAILCQVTGKRRAIAFSRTGNPDIGKLEDAMVLRTFGELSVDLTMLI